MSLLDIPRELRDYILGYVILAHQIEAPSLNQTFSTLIQGREILTNPHIGAWCKTVLYKPEGVVANATSLLVNRQLRSETLDNIKRLEARQYDLDVIILDEILPLPTWLRVPLVTTHLDAVNVTFRIAGKFDKIKNHYENRSDTAYHQWGTYRGFRGGDGAGPAMSWQIYGILERFIKVGPVGKLDDQHANKHQHMAVKTIDINIETPPNVDPSAFGMPRSTGPHFARQQSGDTVLDPKYLAQFVARYLGALLSGGDREWFEYGQVLYEHVDFIVVTLDGEEVRRLDVAERLGAVGGFQERQISQKTLEEYKVGAWARRKERGLRVLDD